MMVRTLGGGVAYFRIGVPTDDDVNRARCALAQDWVDIIQSHVVNHHVIDLHDLIPIAENTKREFKKPRGDQHQFIQLLSRIMKHSGSWQLLLTLLYTFLCMKDVIRTEHYLIFSMRVIKILAEMFLTGVGRPCGPQILEKKCGCRSWGIPLQMEHSTVRYPDQHRPLWSCTCMTLEHDHTCYSTTILLFSISYLLSIKAQ